MRLFPSFLLFRLIFSSLTVLIVVSCEKSESPALSTIPTVTTSPLTNVTTSSATTGGAILTDGNAAITQSGIVWSKTNAMPTLTDSVKAATATSGNFTVNFTIPDVNTVYYIRAFATNTVGTAYGEVVKLSVATDTSKVRFTYNGKDVSYGIIVSSVTGKKWLDRNIGATRVAISVDDYLAYGDLFQWGRPADGHQLINWTSSSTGTPVNGVSTVLATSDNPGNSNFIVPPPPYTSPVVIWDWRSDNNNSRWITKAQGPCPAGWHIPTDDEWAAEMSPVAANGYPTTGTASSGGMKDRNTAFNQLKLTVSGYRDGNGSPESLGKLGGMGNRGEYWSSTNGLSLEGYTVGGQLDIANDFAQQGAQSKSEAINIRCIKN